MADVANTTEKDLQTAITELILDLKGAGTAEALSEKIGVPRNRLTLIFKAYRDQMAGVQSKQRPPQWSLNTLETVAARLGIKVSDIILAAEKILAGLPAWYYQRISKNTQPHSKDRLVNILLEAIGCRTYNDADPLKVKGQRKSLKHCPENWISEELVQNIKAYADIVLKTDAWKPFLLKYIKEKITDEEAYYKLKKMTNKNKEVSIKEEVHISNKKSVLDSDQLNQYLSALIGLGEQVSKDDYHMDICMGRKMPSISSRRTSLSASSEQSSLEPSDSSVEPCADKENK